MEEGMAQYPHWKPWPKSKDEWKEIPANGGVYAILLSESKLSERQTATWKEPGIIYIGMTRSSLKGRLERFDYTLRNTTSRHGGAERIANHYKNSVPIDKLYVSIREYRNSEEDKTAEAIMKEIEWLEIEAFIEFAIANIDKNKRYRLPLYNDPRHRTDKKKKDSTQIMPPI